MNTYRVRTRDNFIGLQYAGPLRGQPRARCDEEATVLMRDVVLISSMINAKGRLELRVRYLDKAEDPASLPLLKSIEIFDDIWELRDWISEQPKSFRDLIQPVTSRQSADIDIIVNPKAGPDGARIDEFLERILEPLLDYTSTKYRTHRTRGVGDAGQIGRKILRGKKQATIAVLGGDGTVHELLNGVLLKEAKQQEAQLDLILL